MADLILAFRQTSGFVTDTEGTYILGTDTYPTTRGGFTFGWASGTYGVTYADNDRDNSVTNKRLAGQSQVIPSNENVVRVDLPATGSYDVRWANGDTGFDFSPYEQYWEVFDNVTSKFSYRKTPGPAQDHYFDATGVDRTEAAWPAGNVASTQTFASTIFNLQLGNADVGLESSYAVIATLQITTGGLTGTAKSYFTQFPKPILRQPLSQGRLL